MTLGCTAAAAHAQDWFQVEAGIGASHVTDMGDGIWIQQGAPGNHETQNTPAFIAGFTGELYGRGNADVRWHADYTYIGTFSAGVDGVPDENYNAGRHQVVGYTNPVYSRFNGQGHVQGIPVTLDAGYTWHGLRFGIEGGMWAYWQTWHESLQPYMQGSVDASHRTKLQFGYVAGASISRGPFSLSYHYYQIRPYWGSNGSPGLATGAHVLMATYRY